MRKHRLRDFPDKAVHGHHRHVFLHAMMRAAIDYKRCQKTPGVMPHHARRHNRKVPLVIKTHKRMEPCEFLQAFARVVSLLPEPCVFFFQVLVFGLQRLEIVHRSKQQLHRIKHRRKRLIDNALAHRRRRRMHQEAQNEKKGKSDNAMPLGKQIDNKAKSSKHRSAISKNYVEEATKTGRYLSKSSRMRAAPLQTQVIGSSITLTERPVSLRIRSSRPRNWEPPPVRIMPLS